MLHQVHPAKLAIDICASMMSNRLLWQHRLAAGAAVRLLFPLGGSALVLSTADVSALRHRAAGRYVLAHMPATAQATAWQGTW